MDSFFSWIGGKKALRETIVDKFPMEYEQYIEVFGGAGWVLFHKKPETFEVYNDFNSNLVNMYHVVKNKPMEFLKEVGFLPLNSRQEFKFIRKWIEKESFDMPYLESENDIAKKYLHPLDYKEYLEVIKEQSELADVRRAVMFFKLIRYSYASGTKSFGNQPTNIAKIGKSLWQINKRLNINGVWKLNRNTDGEGNGVVIENKDCVDLILQYDRVESFFYLDPPYYMAEKCYDKVFAEEDHIRLHDALKNIKGKFMLSYNKCDFICDMYKDFYITEVSRLNNISQRYESGNMYEEVIVTNYDPEERQQNNPKQISIF